MPGTLRPRLGVPGRGRAGYALPEVPELESGAWKVVNTGPFAWQSDASRQVENFTDFGHFPWVHPGLLGDPERPVVPDHKVDTDGHVLHYTIVRPEAPNRDDFQVFANPDTVNPERRSRYELHLPYTIVLRLGWGGEKGMVYFFASQPETPERCRGYCIIGRNYDLDDPDSTLQEFERVIFGQDQRIVESQRPEQVPFDLADELHLKFDAVAVAYRRAMQAQGLASQSRRRTAQGDRRHVSAWAYVTRPSLEKRRSDRVPEGGHAASSAAFLRRPAGERGAAATASATRSWNGSRCPRRGSMPANSLFTRCTWALASAIRASASSTATSPRVASWSSRHSNVRQHCGRCR